MNPIVAPSVVEDLPAEQYHAHPYSSNSSLKDLPDDPESYFNKYVLPPEDRPTWAKRPMTVTPAMKLGTAFHSVLLENQELTVLPKCLLASNGAATTKMAKDFISQYPDCVKQDDYDDLCFARDRCLSDPEIRPFLETQRRAELSIFWTDEETGETCRGRLDSLCEFSDGLWILDLKFGSADPNDEDAIGWKVYDMGYHVAAAMYTDGTEATIGTVTGFVFLFCRNSPPFDAGLWRITPRDLELGRDIYRAKLSDLRRRRASGDWHNPAFGDTQLVTLPKRAWENESPKAFSEFNPFGEVTK